MYLGKFRALAVDNNDPENRGRIRVRCPHIYGEFDSPWCEPCVPYADGQEGIFFIPSLGQGVWIECEEGDYDRPIWVGYWWAENELNGSTFADKNIQIIKGKNKVILKVGSGQITLQNGSITIDGTVTINGSVQVNSSIDATGDIKAGSISLKDHTHIVFAKADILPLTTEKPL